MIFDFDNARDDEINAQIAITCDGYAAARRQYWKEVNELADHPNGDYYATYIKTGLRCEVPDYTHRLDRTMPLLEKAFVAFQWNPGDRCFSYLGKVVSVPTNWKSTFGAIPLDQGAFCRAACKALLLHYGVQLI